MDDISPGNKVKVHSA